MQCGGRKTVPVGSEQGAYECLELLVNSSIISVEIGKRAKKRERWFNLEAYDPDKSRLEWCDPHCGQSGKLEGESWNCFWQEKAEDNIETNNEPSQAPWNCPDCPNCTRHTENYRWIGTNVALGVRRVQRHSDTILEECGFPEEVHRWVQEKRPEAVASPLLFPDIYTLARLWSRAFWNRKLRTFRWKMGFGNWSVQTKMAQNAVAKSYKFESRNWVTKKSKASDPRLAKMCPAQQLTFKQIVGNTKLNIEIPSANITLQSDGIARLSHPECLNDEIINSFSSLINKRNSDRFNPPVRAIEVNKSSFMLCSVLGIPSTIMVLWGIGPTVQVSKWSKWIWY